MASAVASPFSKPFHAVGQQTGMAQLVRADSLSSSSLTESVFSADHGQLSPDARSMDLASSVDSGDYPCLFSALSMPSVFPQVEQLPLDIALRIQNSQGKVQILKFSFDLEHDSYESVAREMVSDLELPDSETPAIAAKIQASVKKEHVKRLQQRQESLLVMPTQAAATSEVAPSTETFKPELRRCVSTSGVPGHCDAVSFQHQALAAKHSQRMSSLLASCQRRGSKSSTDDGENDVVHPRRRSLDSEAQRRTKVNYCVFRGMYVPDIVKKPARRSCCATVLETQS